MLAGAFEQVGFARIQDYCVERLACSRRTAELLRQQAVLMERYADVRDAFLSGDLEELANTPGPAREDDGGTPPSETHDEKAAREQADATGETRPVAGTWLTYRLPPEWVAAWDTVVEHFNRTQEADLRPWHVLELLAADFNAGRPLELPVLPGDSGQMCGSRRPLSG